MPANWRFFPWLLVAVAFGSLSFISVTHCAAQIAQPPEKVELEQHQHAHHHLHIPMGEETCAVAYTYEDGPLGPSHWPSVCATGKMQSPIDMTSSRIS